MGLDLNILKKINFPQIVEGTDKCVSWDDWLDKTEQTLKSLGYTKYKQHIKREDFAYWKPINEKYQVGVFFYDFRKYDPNERIGIQFECMFIHDVKARIDLSVCKDKLDLNQFEKMASDFYDAMLKYTE